MVRFKTRKDGRVFPVGTDSKGDTNPTFVKNPNQEIRISLRELKKLRDKAVAEGKDRFFVNGKPILVKFAKFMFQFIEMENKRKGLRDTDKITLQPTKNPGHLTIKKNKNG